MFWIRVFSIGRGYFGSRENIWNELSKLLKRIVGLEIESGREMGLKGFSEDFFYLFSVYIKVLKEFLINLFVFFLI